MSNVRAEVLRVSRTRSGWRENTQKPSQRPYISSLKFTFEGGTHERLQCPEPPKSSEAATKPSRLGGTKVSTIANMFQALTPTKEEVYHARPGFAKPESPKTEHSKKVPAQPEEPLPPEEPPRTERRSSAQDAGPPREPTTPVGGVHLNRTESHLARFNTARAMFERLEEASMRKNGSVSTSSKRRSGSVSPSRSSPIRATFSPNRLSRSPSPGETQSMGSSPKRESPLSPRDKSRSADSILGERSRENSGAFYQHHHSSQLNGRRHELELDLHECGAGEAIISPGAYSPEFSSYLPPSPVAEAPRTNGSMTPKCGEETPPPEAAKSAGPAKPAPLSPKPTEAAPRTAVPKRRELPKPTEASPAASPKASPKHQNRAAATPSQRPRIVSATPSSARTRLAEERSKSHIPQLQKDPGGLAARRAAARAASPVVADSSSSGNSKADAAPTLVSAVEKSHEDSPVSSPTSSAPNGTVQDRAVPNGSARDASGRASTFVASSSPSSSSPPVVPPCRVPGASLPPRPEADSSPVACRKSLSSDATIGGCASSAPNHIPDPSVSAQGTQRLSHISDSQSGSQTLVLSSDRDSPGPADQKATSPVGQLPTHDSPAAGLRPAPEGAAAGLETVQDSAAIDSKTTTRSPPDLPDLNQRWSAEAVEQLASKPSITLSDTEVSPAEPNKHIVVNSQGTSPLSPPWNERTILQESKAINQVNGKIHQEEVQELLIGQPAAVSDARTAEEEPEIMTLEEAEHLLSSPELLSDEEATEVKKMLTKSIEIINGDAKNQMVTEETNLKQQADYRRDYDGPYEENPEEEEDDDEEEEEEEEEADEAQEGAEEGVHYLADGHYWVEVPGLPESDEDDVIDTYQSITMPKKRERVKFSMQPIRVYSTFSGTDYDRRNDDVDPVSASAEYELEKRVEKMEVFPVELLKGPEGLGLSIIGMGVGADAGLEKLGIFVKTITEGGAAHKDGCIRVNDQIIEVDMKSLVGVTQAYAASVLRNTSGIVRFLIGREKDGENSEVAQLISQSLQADLERDERRRVLEQELQNQRQHAEGDSRSDSYPGLTLPIPSLAVQPPCSPQVMVQEDSTPEEGEDGPTCEVFDLEDDSSDSPSPDSDVTTLRIKLKETQYKNAVADAEIAKSKSKVAMLEALQNEHQEYEKRLQLLTMRLAETEKVSEATRKEVMTYQDMLEESQGQYILLEKKYYKAKKLIKEFQQRQQDLFHREEYHIQQLQEKDQEYNALVKSLKDRVIQLEQDLMETQKAAGLPVRLPYDNTSIKQLQLTPQQLRKPQVFNQKRRSSNGLEVDISDSELSDGDFAKYDISPDSDDAEKKTSTVERKPPSKDDVFEKAVPQTELLDSTAAKAKAELASKGSLANRQPPSIKKTGSIGSSGDGTSLDQKDSDSSTSLGSSREDLNDSTEPSFGDKLSTSTSVSSDTSPVTTPLPSCDGGSVPHKVSQTDYSLTAERSNLNDHYHKSVSRLHQSVINTTQQMQVRSTSPSSTEGRASAVKIDDRFAEEMRVILERKNLEAKRQIASEEIDQFGIPVEKSYGHPQPSVVALDVPRNPNSSPGSTVSSQSSCSNATANSDPGTILVSKRTLEAGISYSAKRDSSSGCARFCPQSEPTPRGPPLSCCCLPGAAQTADSMPMEQSAYPAGIDLEGGSLSGAKTQQPQSVLGDHGFGGSMIPGGAPDRRAHQWLSCSVLEWSTGQVGQWLLALSMEQYISSFLDGNINGQELMYMDGTKLKTLGVLNGNDRSILKKKIKELRAQLEKERKAAEKEVRAREKMQRKAEKAAEKAGKRK